MGSWRKLGRAWWSRAAPRSFLRWARPSTQELGRCGEELAARWLRRRGARLRGRRLRTPAAEVDLWIEYRGVGWVVEVKTGRACRGPWRPADSLGHAQRERLGRACTHLARRLGIPHGVLLVEVQSSRAELRPRISCSTLQSPRIARRA